MDNESIKKNIASLRKSRRLTQEDVAGRMGMSRQSYLAIEKGNTRLLGDKIARLAEIFGVSREELLLGYVPQPEEHVLRQEREKYNTELGNCRQTIEHLNKLLASKEQTIANMEQIIELQRQKIAALSASIPEKD